MQYVYNFFCKKYKESKFQYCNFTFSISTHFTLDFHFWKLAFLIPGDEVLQWNGKSLPGATKKEVYNIILESKAEPQVEIVVSRPIG